MTKQEKLFRLIKIADFLDRNELTEDAALVDEIISEKSAPSPTENTDTEPQLEIPQEEYDLLKQVYLSLGQAIE